MRIKTKLTLKNYGIWFEEAQTIWADPLATEFYDSDHSNNEERFIRLGYSSHSRLLLVVYCERDPDGTIWIISARKATPRERKQYEEGI